MITGIVSLQLMQFFMNVGSVSGTFGMMKKIAQIMDTDSEPDGAVEAAGTPDELLKTNEYYRMFVKTL